MVNHDPHNKWCDDCYKRRVSKKERQYDEAISNRELFDKHWKIATWQPEEVA
tara:strand:+ start:1318 stop:1473 length:156 start_codon:yes stop_codon:yes gene_type:complete